MRLVCISDTHFYPVEVPIPDGDVLIHAGDLTYQGTRKQIKEAGEWLASQPHPHKVVVAGNHDFLFESHPAEARELIGPLHYLQDEELTIDGVRFYGAPWSAAYMDWAFGVRAREYEAVWSKVPEGLDVLITHGPPLRILDMAPNRFHLGDAGLLKCVEEKAPRVHVFGHIHESHGTAKVGSTLFVNAAICDEMYNHTQAPIVLDLKANGVMEITS